MGPQTEEDISISLLTMEGPRAFDVNQLACSQ